MTTKERPIIFNDNMAQAVFEGRKTQTRRFVKPQLDILCRCPYCQKMGVKMLARVCPYGKVGDRLWVREEHKLWRPNEWWHVRYRDGTTKRLPVGGGDGPNCLSPEDAGCDEEAKANWRSSIHMPRWAARSLLEITAIRAERLQDISEADARAEGCNANIPHGMSTAVTWFYDTWDRIHGADLIKGWDANPWVWVIEFRRVFIEEEEK